MINLMIFNKCSKDFILTDMRMLEFLKKHFRQSNRKVQNKIKIILQKIIKIISQYIRPSIHQTKRHWISSLHYPDKNFRNFLFNYLKNSRLVS